MRLLSLAMIPAIIGVLLVSAGVAPVDPRIGAANQGPAPGARPAGAHPRLEVQRTLPIQEDRDRDAALGLFLLLNMHGGRHGR